MKLLVALLCGAALALAGAARADEIEVTEVQLVSSDEGLALSADFAFELKPRLAEAVANGVSLYFVVEFELTRSRWWWFDEKAASRRLQFRLSYNALSRHYRLSTGVLQQNYATLEEALNVLRRLRGWNVLDRGAALALADASYDAAVRMRLDITLLPKPFQLSALTSRELNLESHWKRFPFRPPPPAPAPVETREPRETEAR